MFVVLIQTISLRVWSAIGWLPARLSRRVVMQLPGDLLPTRFGSLSRNDPTGNQKDDQSDRAHA
jgi:hypothetical protein